MTLLLTVRIGIALFLLTVTHGSFLGNSNQGRPLHDQHIGRRVIIPGYAASFKENGKIERFDYYNDRSGTVRFQVWRIIHPRNATGVYTCQLVGQTEPVTTPTVPSATSHAPSSPLDVRQGDILGIEYMDVNPIPYDTTQCNQPAHYAMYKDVSGGVPIKPDVQQYFHRLPSTDLDKCRLYSLGAQVNYESEACTALTAVVGLETVLTSPGYDGQRTYQNNVDVCWTITSPAGRVVRLNVTHSLLELATTSGTCYDYVEVRDGNKHDTSPVMQKWCGVGHPQKNPMFSIGQTLAVNFVTDGAGAMNGFRMLFTAVVPGDNSQEVLPIASTTPLPTPRPINPGEGGGSNIPGQEGEGTGENTTKEEANKTGMYLGIAVGAVAFVSIVSGVILGVLYTNGVFKSKPQPGEEDKVRRLSTGPVMRPQSSMMRPRTGLQRPQTAVKRPTSSMSAGSTEDVVSEEEDGGDVVTVREAQGPDPVMYRPKTPKGPPPSHLPPLGLGMGLTPTGPPPSRLPPMEDTMVVVEKKKRKKRPKPQQTSHEQSVQNPAFQPDYKSTDEDDAAPYPNSPPPAYSTD